MKLHGRHVEQRQRVREWTSSSKADDLVSFPFSHRNNKSRTLSIYSNPSGGFFVLVVRIFGMVWRRRVSLTTASESSGGNPERRSGTCTCAASWPSRGRVRTRFRGSRRSRGRTRSTPSRTSSSNHRTPISAPANVRTNSATFAVFPPDTF